jgi:hypothetical protein
VKIVANSAQALDEAMSTTRTASSRGFGGSTPNSCGCSPLSTQRQNLPLGSNDQMLQHPKSRERTAQRQAEEEKIRREMGDAAFELAGISYVATTGYLMHELSIIDRIDAMIDRCLKRLLLVRGVKSISPSLSKPTPKQIPSS